MVDRRVHGPDRPRCPWGGHVRPSAIPRDRATGGGPHSREGTRERSRIRSKTRGLSVATPEALVAVVPVGSGRLGSGPAGCGAWDSGRTWLTSARVVAELPG